MAEYIDKSKLYKKIAESEEKARKTFLEASINDPFFDIYQAKMNELTALKHIVSDMESSDVAPMVHGKWVGYDASYYRYYSAGAYPVNLIRYKCSICGRSVSKKEPYCHCGARMDL